MVSASPSPASRWAISAATAPGARHLEDGEPSEDAFVHARLDSALFMAVADGAGSAPRAAEGANAAVGTALDVARRRLSAELPTTGEGWRTLMTDIAGETLRRVQAAAGALSEAPGDATEFGCTLVAAVVTDAWAALLAIGDSFAVLRRGDGGLHLPHPPKGADGDITQTVLISQDDAMGSLIVTVIEDPALAAVALASDGLDQAAVSRLADHPVAHAPFLDPLIDQAAGANASARLAAYLLLDPILIETTDDDRTLVIAVRR